MEKNGFSETTSARSSLTLSPKGAALSSVLCLGIGVLSCSNLPTHEVKKYEFPPNAFTETPKRSYESLGTVRSKVNFSTLDPNHDEVALCSNYFNRAVTEMMKQAKQSQADAVIDIKSVVFLYDGRKETYSTPECSDDGQEGQVLTQGTAVRWKPEPSPLPTLKISD